MRHSAKLPTRASNCFPEMEWLMKGRKVPSSLYMRNALGLMALPLNSTDRHHLPGWRLFVFFKYIKIKMKNNLQNKTPRYSAGKSSWHVVSELILSCPGTCQWKEWLDSENLLSLDFHMHRFDHETAGKALPLGSNYEMCAQKRRRKGWQWITGLTKFPPVLATSAAVEAFLTFSVASHQLTWARWVSKVKRCCSVPFPPGCKPVWFGRGVSWWLCCLHRAVSFVHSLNPLGSEGVETLEGGG